MLGCTKTGSYVSEKENVDEDILTIGYGPYAVEVDLMQPLDPTVPPKVCRCVCPAPRWDSRP